MRVLSDLIFELGLPVEARPVQLCFVKPCAHPFCQRNASVSVRFFTGKGSILARYLCTECAGLVIELATGEPDPQGWIECR